MQRKHQQQSTYLFDPEEEEKKKPVKQAWNLQTSMLKLMLKILKWLVVVDMWNLKCILYFAKSQKDVT